MGRVFATVLVTAIVCAPLGTAEAASGHQVVRGPGSLDGQMFLTYVPCGSFFGGAAAPQLRIHLGPEEVPLGRRSFGLVPSGTGTASGPYLALSSLAGDEAVATVHSGSGATGASYVWVSVPGAPRGQAWSGRADLTVGPGWQEVDSAELRYTWTRFELGSGQPVADGGQATIEEFTAAHGDGPGYVVLGFGCDGQAFNVDAVRSAGRTYDFEGIDVTTSIDASHTSVAAGGTAVISGAVRDLAGRLMGDPLVLQARVPGTPTWRTLEEGVLADETGVSRAEVVVTETLEYRWYRPESQYADAGWTEPVVVRVAQEETTTSAPQPPQSEPPPAPAPAPEPEPAPEPPPAPAPAPAPEPEPELPQPAPAPAQPAPAQPAPAPAPPVPAAEPAPAPAEPAPQQTGPPPAPESTTPTTATAPVEQTDTSAAAG